MKKKVTILFSHAHLSYSPTVIGLYDLLSQYFDVTILAENPAAFSNKLLTNRNIIYRKGIYRKNLQRFYRLYFNLRAIFDSKIATLLKMNFSAERIYDFKVVSQHFARNSPDFIIAVDFRSLLYMQLLNKNAEFLSLEISKDDTYYAECNFKNIKSVIIQTKERYQHLFGNREFNTFFVQNAPSFKKYSDEPKRENLVYCGTAWNPFGFYHCLEFLKKNPEYKLYVKGSLSDKDRINVETNYRDLIFSKQMVIDAEYLDDNEVVSYLRKFRAGFCFYNFEVEWIDTFNYYSAPSGKMFKYLAAGVPVIGQNILGLNPIKEFDCGVLIEDLTAESIRKAVEKVENNFDYYSQNCLRAAEHYSFDKNVEPFIKYLLNNSK